MTTVRLLMADCARKNGTLFSADIPNAFAVGDDDAETAYMFAAPGEKEYDNGVEIVYRVQNIYGRQTAARCYQDRFNCDMLELGAVRSKLDPCFYKFPATPTRGEIQVVVWIDDLLISTTCQKGATWIKTQLKAKYERLDGDDIAWRQAKHVLGLDVVQDETFPPPCWVLLCCTAGIASALYQRLRDQQQRIPPIPLMVVVVKLADFRSCFRRSVQVQLSNVIVLNAER